MQVFKQFHMILLDIFNHMLPTIYTVKSLEPVLNCTEGESLEDFDHALDMVGHGWAWSRIV